MGVHAECPSCARLVSVSCPSVLLPPCCASPHLAAPARSGFVARLLLRRCGGVPPFRYRPYRGLRTAAHYSPRRCGGQPLRRRSLGGFGASPRNTLALPRPLPRRLRRLPPPLRSLRSLPVGGSPSLPWMAHPVSSARHTTPPRKPTPLPRCPPHPPSATLCLPYWGASVRAVGFRSSLPALCARYGVCLPRPPRTTPCPLPRRLRRLPPPLRSLRSLPVGGSDSLLVRYDYCPSCVRSAGALRMPPCRWALPCGVFHSSVAPMLSS